MIDGFTKHGKERPQLLKSPRVGPEVLELLQDRRGSNLRRPEREVQHREIGSFTLIGRQLTGSLLLTNKALQKLNLLQGVNMSQPGHGLRQRLVPQLSLLKPHLMPKPHPPGLAAAINIVKLHPRSLEIASEPHIGPEYLQLFLEESAVLTDREPYVVQYDLSGHTIELDGASGRQMGKALFNLSLQLFPTASYQRPKGLVESKLLARLTDEVEHGEAFLAV